MTGQIAVRSFFCPHQSKKSFSRQQFHPAFSPVYLSSHSSAARRNKKILATENGLPLNVREGGRMDFIKYISDSLVFAPDIGARKLRWIAACALLAAAAGLAHFNPHRAP